MVSGAMICIPNFIKIGSAVEKFMGTEAQTACDRIRLLLFFQNKESRLKTFIKIKDERTAYIPLYR
jgi:hypothetical protein